MSAPDTQMAQFLASAVQRVLGYDPAQVFVAAAPDYDPGWKFNPVIEVCPGAMRNHGGGDGAQDGGAMIREQEFEFWVFYRCQLDQYSTSTMILIEQERGILDVMESLRKVFQISQFPLVASPTASQFAIIEPMKWMGESKTTWEDPILRVMKRSMTQKCVYGVELPDSTQLVLADYL